MCLWTFLLFDLEGFLKLTNFFHLKTCPWPSSYSLKFLGQRGKLRYRQIMEPSKWETISKLKHGTPKRLLYTNAIYNVWFYTWIYNELKQKEQNSRLKKNYSWKSHFNMKKPMKAFQVVTQFGNLRKMEAVSKRKWLWGHRGMESLAFSLLLSPVFSHRHI